MGNSPQATEAARWLARANEAAGDKSVPVEDVLALYRKALALDPTQVEGWADYGASLGYLGHYDDALAALDQGLAVDPRHRRCLTFRGDTLKRTGDHAGAVEAYHRLVAAHADDAAAWVKYGIGLDLVGRFEEALAAMNRALDLHPRFLDAVNGRAKVEAHMGRIPTGGIPLDMSPGQFMRAIAEEKMAEIMNDRAVAATERGGPAGTAAAEPSTPDACHARAVALAEGGDHAQALACLEEALRLAPRHLPALEAIVTTLAKLGRPRDALAWCEKWIAHPLLKERDRARALCTKGVCLRQMHDFTRSVTAIDEALKLDPANVAFAKERATTVAELRRRIGTTKG